MSIVLEHLSDGEERYSIAHADFDLRDELKITFIRGKARILKEEGFTKEQRRFLLKTENLERRVYDFIQKDAISDYQRYKRFMQEEGGLSKEQSERLWASYNAGILGDTKSNKAERAWGILQLGTLAAMVAIPTVISYNWHPFLAPLGFGAGILLAKGTYNIITENDGLKEEEYKRDYWFYAKPNEFPMPVPDEDILPETM